MKDRYFDSAGDALYARKCVDCGGYAKIGSPIVRLKGASGFHGSSPIYGALCSRHLLREIWEDQGMVTLPKAVSAGKE